MLISLRNIRLRSKRSSRRAGGPRTSFSVLLFALLLVPSIGGAQGIEDEVQREWEVRRWALDPVHSGPQLRAAFASSRWNERVRALEALLRDLCAGGQPAALHHGLFTRALSDPHVSVRARALELGAALARHSVALGADDRVSRPLLSEALARSLVHEPFVAVRLGLVHMIAAKTPRDAVDMDWELLGVVLRDPDERVRAAAHVALANIADGWGERPVPRLDDWPSLTRGERDRVLSCLVRAPQRAGRAGLPPSVWPILDPDGLGLRELVGLARSGDIESVSSWRRALGRFGDWTAEERALLPFAARRWNAAARKVFFEVLIDLSRAALSDPGLADQAAEFAFAVAQCGAGADVLSQALSRSAEAWPWEARIDLVDAVGPWVDRWDGAQLELWAPVALEAARPRDLRLALLEALDFALGERGDGAAAPLLARLLEDPDQRIRARAFFSLAAAPGGAREDRALAQAWSEFDDSVRIHRLERLSRAEPIPALREPLLAWAAAAGRRRSAAVELLAAFHGDDEIRRTFEAWLEEELARIEAGGADARRARGRAAQLARALGRVDPAACVPRLLDVLARTHSNEEDVAKATVVALASSPAGLRALQAWMGAEVGRRTRVEAALQLLLHGDTPARERTRAVQRVLADYPHLAWDLGSRVIVALGTADEPRAVEFLCALALAGRARERGTAVEALAHLEGAAASAALERVVLEDSDLELRRLALRLLGQRAQGDVLERIGREWDRDRTAQPAEFLQALREELRVALAAAGRVGASELGLWLREAESKSRNLLPLELRGERIEGADFRWRSETAIARELARHGHLGTALEQQTEVWKLDGQLLRLLAQGAGEESSLLAFELERAALIALLGEREAGPGVLDKTHLSLLGRAWRGENWAVFRSLAAAALASYVDGDFNHRAWRAAFGLPDRARGADPAARLMSAMLQSEARAALVAGHLEEARTLSRRAARWVGYSSAAAQAQADLEELLFQAR